MKTARTLLPLFAILCLLGLPALGGGIPRSALLVKESGNDFLAAKRYADAVDSFLQAVQLCPDYAEAHYNLGVALLKGFKAFSQAGHHFSKYLELNPDAVDRDEVKAFVASLAERAKTARVETKTVIGILGGRLLISGGGWAQVGDRIEIAESGKDPCACLTAEYVYPDSVLTQRVWDDKTLDVIKTGLLAVGSSR